MPDLTDAQLSELEARYRYADPSKATPDTDLTALIARAEEEKKRRLAGFQAQLRQEWGENLPWTWSADWEKGWDEAIDYIAAIARAARAALEGEGHGTP